MKVLHVISGISKKSGGPSRSSQGLVAAICEQGMDAYIHSFDGADPWISGVRGFKQGGELTKADLRSFDIVHIHGVWDLRLSEVAKLCRKTKIPYVIAPRGMLEPWSLKQKWLKKRIARFLYQDRDLKKAAALHATAESEAEQFRKLGFKNYCIVSPNGVNLPEGDLGLGERCRCTADCRRALFVSRMHPKKGVLELVESWARVMKGGKSVVSNRITESWFDVEDPDIIRGLPTIRISAAEEALADRRAIKDVFRRFGFVENAADGRKVTFPSKSAGKMLGQRGVDLYRLAGSFAELFNKSRRAWSETEAAIDDHKEHRNIGAYHQYIAKFSAGTDDCYIRFTVREEKGTKNTRNEVHSSTVSRVTVYKAKGAELSNLGHAQAEDSTPFVDNKIAYFFTRVNPVWQCELVYTMNSDEERAYEQRVKDRILSLGMSYKDKDGNVHCTTTTSDYDFVLTGPLDDEKKWEAYARADLFVLPTYSENFGIVVAEALWAGVPVITTKGTPWKELEERKCGWWIDIGVEPLVVALKEAMSHSDEERAAMGARGRKLVEEKYTWDAVCKAMVDGYKDVLNHGIH